jgi:hypothetical protein
VRTVDWDVSFTRLRAQKQTDSHQSTRSEGRTAERPLSPVNEVARLPKSDVRLKHAYGRLGRQAGRQNGREYGRTPPHRSASYPAIVVGSRRVAQYVHKLLRALEIGLFEEGAYGAKPGTVAPALPHGPRAGPGSTGVPAIDSPPD